MKGKKEWHAVYTRPRGEKKVFAALLRQDIEAYCPMSREMKQWSDRRKLVELPLFTSYVFVRVAPEEQLKVRMTDGVVNFVYWLGRIAAIRDEEMAEMQDFVNTHGQIRIEPISYAKGDLIDIKEGILKGQQGIVQAVRKNKLELIMKSLNVRLIVDAPAAG